ncbi:leucine-rich repeat-containing protein 72-like [Saccoglossus kowalevskii]|uniref:Leucine-rich repeat-containing protein 72-like n=1 Tax=Saccoglossus kowalevskii TaxID=10224 RepID=A0ABM0GRN4_SACKO|nr:PREDICTED: leucine-rich repeat-containing protein 72-like [Saccoglossus kowalevskii]
MAVVATSTSTEMRSEKLIKEQMENEGIRKDIDVTQLYLADSDLQSVTNLSRFKMLKNLYLNGNKLRRINCLKFNYRLAELYLENNQLVDISGALKHLTSLHTLMLQRNQLTKLEETVQEFKAMQSLKVLNLFSNPLAQEHEYRMYVIHFVPSIELLDRSEVLKDEQDRANQLYQQEREVLKQSIAFGRRCEGPPIRGATPVVEDNHIYDPKKLVANNFHSPPLQNPDDAVTARANNRSVMQYSVFDWSKVPKLEERRQKEPTDPAPVPQVITVRFK